MKKAIIMIVLSILAAFGMMGCKTAKPQSFRYDANEITAMEIKTGAHPVQLVKGSGDTIIASFTEDTAKVKDGTLYFNIPDPKGGINLKEPPALIVNLPDKVFDTISITSDSGNISIENVGKVNLTVNAQYGNITLTGGIGSVTAKSEMDSIKTELPIGNDITAVSTVGQEVTGQIGDSKNVISLYTNTGTIELK